MDYRKMLQQARDLYNKAAACEDAEERKDLMAQAEDIAERAELAKKGAGIVIDEPEPETKAPSKASLRDLMANEGYTDAQIKAVVGRLSDDEGGLTSDGGQKEYSFADFLLAETRNDESALKAMGSTKQLVEGAGASGGWLVPVQELMQLLQAPGIARVVRDNGPTIIPMSSNEMTIPALDQSGVPTADSRLMFEGGVQAAWTAEATLKTETEPSFRQIRLVARKLAGFTQASDELLDDNAVGLEALLRTLFGRAIARIEDHAFMNGVGVTQPLGILNSPALEIVARDTANQVNYADIADMWASLPSWSMGSATWVVSQRALSQFIQMTDGAGNHVFMPQESGGAKQNVMGTVFGRPLVITEILPALGAQADVCLIDYSYYVIGDRQATTIASSRDFAFTQDLTTWRFVHRVDGQPWIQAPFYISTTDTVSPFVVLAA